MRCDCFKTFTGLYVAMVRDLGRHLDMMVVELVW